MSGRMKRKTRPTKAPAANKRSKPSAAGKSGAGAKARPKKNDRLDDDFLIESDSDTGAQDNEARDLQRLSGLAHAGSDSDEDAVADGAAAGGAADANAEEDEFADETIDEHRVRLAKDLLKRLHAEVDQDQGAEDGEDDESDEEEEEDKKKGITGTRGPRDAISAKLHEALLQHQGKLQRKLADKLAEAKTAGTTTLTPSIHRGHRLTVTCIAIGHDDLTAFSGSKDGSIIHWDIQTGKKLHTILGARGAKGRAGHTDEVLALATSTDGKFLVSGGRDNVIRVWDLQSNYQQIKVFEGHRGAITCLAFRQNSRDLFSGSEDRCIKVWNLENMAYVETLFGHQAPVTSMDALFELRAVTAGVDKTVRLWKVVEESQLLFQGPKSSLDAVAMLNEEKFVSGGQEGTIQAWNARKKRPTWVVDHAHGGQWITALAALQFADIAASGSSDGTLRLWRWTDRDQLQPLAEIPVPGFINALAFSKNGRYLVVGVGQEHKFGRWTRIQEGRVGIQVIPLNLDARPTTLSATAPIPKPLPSIPSSSPALAPAVESKALAVPAPAPIPVTTPAGKPKTPAAANGAAKGGKPASGSGKPMNGKSKPKGAAPKKKL